jgi:transposase
LVIEDGRTIAEVARGIGMSPQTLGNWVAKTRAIEPADKKLNETEREELERLRHENADLRMKYEFSKK